MTLLKIVFHSVTLNTNTFTLTLTPGNSVLFSEADTFSGSRVVTKSGCSFTCSQHPNI